MGGSRGIFSKGEEEVMRIKFKTKNACQVENNSVSLTTLSCNADSLGRETKDIGFFLAFRRGR
jgi:hypothetical protein